MPQASGSLAADEARWSFAVLARAHAERYLLEMQQVDTCKGAKAVSMKKQILRVGMIGAGSWARRHLEAFAANENTEVAVIWNRSPQKARKLADEFGIHEVAASEEAVSHRGDIDIISISMPHNMHHPSTKRALATGKHVFCEKPLAMNVAEAQEMVKKAQEKNLKTGIQFGHRSDASFRHLSTMIRDGNLGTIQYVEINMCFDLAMRNESFPLIWRMSKSIAGAGALGDLGVYGIDRARWLAGEIRSVCATTRTFIRARPTISDRYDAYEIKDMAAKDSFDSEDTTGQVDNDDECNVLMEFENGAHGYLRSSRFHEDRSLRICGSKAEARIEIPRQSLSLKAFGEDNFAEVDIPEMQGSPTIVSHFVDNILNDTDNAPTFYDGLKAQEVIDACLVSARERRWVDV